MKTTKRPAPAAAQGPRCPICGRRSSVRRLNPPMHYCDHCHQAFNADAR